MRVFLRKTFSRPLRFSGIDSSALLVRRMASFFIVGGGERGELNFIKRSSIKGSIKSLIPVIHTETDSCNSYRASEINEPGYLFCLSSIQIVQRNYKIYLVSPYNTTKRQSQLARDCRFNISGCYNNLVIKLRPWICACAPGFRRFPHTPSRYDRFLS